jgi:hypothetical protein
MKRLNFIGVFALLGLSSCVMIGASKADAPTTTFLPGECFVGASIEYRAVKTNDSRVYFPFYITNANDVVYEGYGKKRWGPGATKAVRFVPSDEVYAVFGENSEAVKSEFIKIFNEFDNYLSSDRSWNSELFTILYNEGSSTLTADKEFAGRQPGENLIDLMCNSKEDEYRMYDPVNSFFEIPLDYDYMLNSHFNLYINIESYDLVEDSVNFELKMPVKVVMYLNWLNDKISDPDAPVPYEERELYCKFTTDFNLK